MFPAIQCANLVLALIEDATAIRKMGLCLFWALRAARFFIRFRTANRK